MSSRRDVRRPVSAAMTVQLLPTRLYDDFRPNPSLHSTCRVAGSSELTKTQMTGAALAARLSGPSLLCKHVQAGQMTSGQQGYLRLCIRWTYKISKHTKKILVKYTHQLPQNHKQQLQSGRKITTCSVTAATMKRMNNHYPHSLSKHKVYTKYRSAQ